MSERLEDLYKEVILKHNEHPVNYEKKGGALHQVEAYNQFCGDHFYLYFDIKDGKIQEISFHGYGCAISKASSSVLVEILLGKSVEEAKELYKGFINIIQTSDDFDEKEIDHRLLAFAAARKFPGRKKCATLSWDCFMEYLEE